MLKPVLAVAAVAVLAGCGGQSDEDAVRDAATDYVEATRSNDAGDMCRLTTDQAKCLKRVAALGAVGEKPSDLLTGREAANIEKMTITVDGDRARGSTGVTFVKRDGQWRIVAD